MRDWNAIISVHDGGFSQAFQRLRAFGMVQKTEYFNVLVLKSEDPFRVLEALHQPEGWEEVSRSIARFMPLERFFTFNSPEEFESKLKESVIPWLPRLAGSGFHVRMHRRGFKGRISSANEERMLDSFLMNEVVNFGAPGNITFSDPDSIVAIETLGPRAGLSLWNRDQVKQFNLLHLD